MNYFTEFETRVDRENEEIEFLNEKIRVLQLELEKFQKKYPQLFLERSLASEKESLERAAKSEWMNDMVKLRGYREGNPGTFSATDSGISGIEMVNISQTENIEQGILRKQAEAGKLAFRFVGMKEPFATPHEMNRVKHAIEELHTDCRKLEDTKYTKTKRHYSLRGTSTFTPETDLMGVLQRTKKLGEYEKPYPYREILEHLKRYIEWATKETSETREAKKVIDRIRLEIADLEKERHERES